MASRIKWTNLNRGQKAKATKEYKKLRSRGLSEAYSKRIAKATAKGKTRQQARGHKPKEHIIRKEREREEHGIAASELKSVRSFLKRYNPHNYKDVPTEEDLVEFIQERGFGAFKIYRGTWDPVRKEYLAAKKSGELLDNGTLGYSLQGLQAASGVPNERWMYYH